MVLSIKPYHLAVAKLMDDKFHRIVDPLKEQIHQPASGKTNN